MIINLIKIFLKIRYNKKNVVIGKNTRILTSYLNFGSEPYLIKIGNNCTITSGVKFITHDASIDVPLNFFGKKRKTPKGKFEKMGKIEVNDNCVIGVNSIILQNVSIGPNSVVGAGSVVTRNVPPNTVVGGNPSKIICTINEFHDKIQKQIIQIPTHKKNEILKVLNS